MKKLLLLLLSVFFLTATTAQQDVISKVDQYIASKEYATAVKLLEHHTASNTSVVLKDKLGEVYAYQGEWDKAIPIYEALKNNNPQNSEYWFRYGGVLAMKAQHSSRFTALTLVGKMKNAFIKAAELDATHVDSRWALVDVYLSLPGIVGGSISKAEKYANELKNISSLDGYLALGYVYEYDDKPKKARESYLNGLNYLKKSDTIERNQLHYQIGKVCGDYGIKVDEGIGHMEAFLDNYSVKDGVTMEWIYYRLARLYRQKNDKTTADKWIQKAIAMNSEFELALKEQQRIAVM